MRILLNKQTDKKLEPVEITADLLREAKTFFDFTKTLKKCAGLAHNQVGGDKRFCAIFQNETLFMINPKIEGYIGISKLQREGCLSFPGKTTVSPRTRIIIVSFYDFEQRKQRVRKLFRFTAQVIQHEVDHLDGKIHIFEDK